MDRRVLQAALVVVRGDEFAIARDQIADQCGLAALTRPRNHDHRRVLERGGHQFGGQTREERVISIVHAGWRLRRFQIIGSSEPERKLNDSADSFRLVVGHFAC